MSAFAKDGIAVEGRLIAGPDPNNHNASTYEFTAAGKRIVGKGLAPDSSIAVGSKVKVVYLPSDPSQSTIENVSESLRESSQSVIPISLLFATGLVFLIYAKRRWIGSRRHQH